MESQSIWRTGYIKLLVGALLVVSIAAAAAYTNLAWSQANSWIDGSVIITVVGKGEVVALPDIGSFTFGVQAEAEDAATAQAQSAQAMNEILAYLAGAGVAENDIKTDNYNLNPQYRWEERVCISGFCPGGEQILDGYQVSQNVTVKVRNLDASGALISGVGERGATNVSSLEFTIDDPANLQAQARTAAIADAKAKSEQLAKDLGVRIVKMTSFWEEDGQYPIQPMYMERSMMAFDVEMSSAPPLPVGENKITSRVNISYEVK